MDNLYIQKTRNATSKCVQIDAKEKYSTMEYEEVRGRKAVVNNDEI